MPIKIIWWMNVYRLKIQRHNQNHIRWHLRACHSWHNKYFYIGKSILLHAFSQFLLANARLVLVCLLFKYKSIKLESILCTSNICTKQRQTLLTQNKCSKIFKYIHSGVCFECFHLSQMLNQNKVKEFSFLTKLCCFMTKKR